VSSFWGRLFDERRDSNRSLGAFVFWRLRRGDRNYFIARVRPRYNASLGNKAHLKNLALPATVDFRSFRTMHSSLMSSVGVRPEVTRDNTGHATVDVTQKRLQPNVVGRTY
jgi:hypothetical protein